LDGIEAEPGYDSLTSLVTREESTVTRKRESAGIEKRERE